MGTRAHAANCAGARAISRMEETFTWLMWLEPDDARIVWLRAEGVRWKPICAVILLNGRGAFPGYLEHDSKRTSTCCGTSNQFGSRWEDHLSKCH
jgi:hypothetical protein